MMDELSFWMKSLIPASLYDPSSRVQSFQLPSFSVHCINDDCTTDAIHISVSNSRGITELFQVELSWSIRKIAVLGD